MITVKQLTTNEITQKALTILAINGFRAWRSNNLAVKGRKFIGMKGVADITGYELHTGVRMECEVKRIGDTLSKDQHEFLSDVALHGGYAFVAMQEGGRMVIKYYYELENKTDGIKTKIIHQ
jgi:hypothetical protein